MKHQNRIEAARAAMARAAWTRGSAPSYRDEAVIEMLADIRHLCAAAGYDFTRCVQLSWHHFLADQEGVR